MARPATAAVRLLSGELEPVRLASTANVDIFAGGLLVIDGVQTLAGHRILLKDQTDGSENGVYQAQLGRWYRASDANSSRALQKGRTVHVQAGTANASKVYVFSTLDPNVGEDDIDIVFFISDDVAADLAAEMQILIDQAEAAAALAAGYASDAVSQGNVPIYATKAGMPAISVPAGISALRVNGYGAAGDGAAALYKKAVSEPSHPGKFQSLDGAWWELAEKTASTKMFGAALDGVTDDCQALKNCYDYCVAAGARMFFSPGILRSSKTWNIKKCIHAEGLAGMHATEGPYPSVLQFDDGIVGIIVHRHDTNANDAGVPVIESSTTGGDGSTIKNLMIRRGAGTRPVITGASSAHGIWLKGHARLQDLQIAGFAGNGIHIVADVSSSDALIYGNANHFYIDEVRSISNGGDGTHIAGGDANAGTANALDGTNNGGWGIYDNSFLGNVYNGGHCSTNGGYSQVRHGGNEYYVLNEALASTTTPGTDDTVWALIGAGSFYPAWVNGGFYLRGGAFTALNANARGTFTGTYTESGQPPARALTPWLILNGQHAAGFTADSSAGYLSTELGAVYSSRPFIHRLQTAALIKQVGLGGGEGHILSASKSDLVGTGPYRLRWSGEDMLWDYFESGPTIAFYLTGEGTARTFGRVNPVPHILAVPKLGLNDRVLGSAPSIPVTVDCARGDVMFNSSPSAAGTVGWVCVTSGDGVSVNGVWKTFGTIAS